MEHTVEKLSGNKVKISFKAPADSFEEAVEKAYLKMRGRINVPGFRKGKAPRKLIERMYGEGVFYEDALEILFPDAYMAAVQENDLHPVSRPELDVQKMEKGQDVEFTCEVYVQPEVKLGDYKGVEVKRVIREVTDDEVSARVEQERKRVARSVDVTDRAVENGDNVTLDYSGSVDGVAFEGGTAQDQHLVIGSNTFIPGFEEQMVGMNIGEEKDLSVKFPEEYHAENLKGKDAVFHVKVNAITREELPALDDDFASEVSDFDTYAEYVADLKKQMQTTADEQSTAQAKESLIQAISDNAEIDIPDPMVEDKLDETMEQMSWRMQQQGFTLEKYMELTGQTMEQMRDMYRSEARNSLKTELVLNEIIKTEDIQADEKEVDESLGEYTAAMNKTVEELKASFSDSQMGYFTHRVKVNKVLDLLWDSAKVTDEVSKPEEKPAEEKTEEKPKAARKPRKKAAEKVEESAEETEEKA